MYYCVILGGISVAGKQGTNNKAATTAGTIPTELGNLRAWKYVVFGKSLDLDVGFTWYMTIYNLTICNFIDQLLCEW